MADEDILFHLTALFSAGWAVLVLALWASERMSRSRHVETFRLYDQLKADIATFERNAAAARQSRRPPPTIRGAERAAPRRAGRARAQPR